MIILPPKEIEDKIKFIHNDVVAISNSFTMTLWLLMALNYPKRKENYWSSIEKF